MKLTIAKFISFFIVLGFSIANTEAQPIGEFKGSLVLAFFNKGSWHSNSFSVDIQSQPPLWHLILKSPDTHEETFVNSNQVEIVTYYDDVVPTSNGLNTATIKLFSGSRPLSSRIEEHIWAALFSRDVFWGKKAPLQDTGLCIEEPCIFTEFQIDEADVSPHLMKWHNERADKYDNQTRIEGEFEWLNETNFSGSVVPLISNLAIEIVSTNGERKPASFSQLTIEDIAPLTSSPQETPVIKGRAPVFDYRFGGKWGRTFVAYDSHEGIIPTIQSPVVQDAKEKNPVLKSKEIDNKFSRYIILAAFMMVSLGFLIFAVITKKQRKD